MKKKLENYELEDFLTDEYFLYWVKTGGEIMPGSIDWQEYLEHHPELRGTIEEARELIGELEQTGIKTTDGQRSDTWNDISRIIFSSTEEEVQLPKVSGYKKRGISRAYFSPLRIAASILVLVTVSTFLIFYFNYDSEKAMVYNNDYGKYQSFILPDSSKVTLNGQSTLTIKEEWGKDQRRELWLKGNAHFEVNRRHESGRTIRESDRFIIHLGDNISVEVLGTVFNISQIGRKTLIGLEEGAIHVGTIKTEKLMSPGEVVSIGDNSVIMERGSINPLWNRKELEMKGATVKEILDLTESVFGVRLEVDPGVNKSDQLDGVLPYDRLPHILSTLSGLLGSRVEAED